MPVYKYAARNSRGARTDGVIDGACVDDVARILVADGLYPSMIEATGSLSVTSLLNRIRLVANPVSATEIIVFTSRLAALLKAGVTIISSLDELIDQVENANLKQAVEQTTKRVRDGSSLSEAMARHGSIFPEVYVAMVSAGELAGSLDICLERISKLMEWRSAIKQRVRDVTRYPKILLFGLATSAYKPPTP